MSTWKHNTKPKTTGEQALTPKQVEKLLSVVTDLEEETLLRLAIATGMRRLDVVNVKTKDVDLENNSVTYYEHKKRRTRTVSIPSSVARVLEMWINVPTEIKTGYLFPPRKENSKSKHMGDVTAYRILQKNLKKAGLPSIPFHALRATCIKLCQFKGYTVEQTAKLVGDTVRVVQEHYTTPSDEEMAQVIRENPII